MKRTPSILKAGLLAGLLCLPALAASAQDYEDDLYYSPSRAKAQEEARARAEAAARQAAGLGASDTYTAGSANPLNMDVDAYNRRNATSSTKVYDGGNR